MENVQNLIISISIMIKTLVYSFIDEENIMLDESFIKHMYEINFHRKTVYFVSCDI